MMKHFALTAAVTLASAACGESAAHHGAASPDASVSVPSDASSVPSDASSSLAPSATGGQLDGSPSTSLPPLPTLTNVVVTSREDSVGIDFDPVDGAVDYRVYALPVDGDVTVHPDMSLTIKNALYRCAGLRQALDLPTNLNSTNTGNGVYPDNDAGLVFPNGVYPTVSATVASAPTLGYVFTTTGPGLSAVFAVGVHPSGGEAGWRESRAKIYTTDFRLRGMLLAQGGRDDGIVFYVPGAASAATQTVYHSETLTGSNYGEYYFTSADLSTHAKDSTAPAPAFEVLTATASGAVPLMAVLYNTSQPHVELASGNERFKRAANQGHGPLWHLEWSGITQPTTLVVEALASGCPYQGFLSPTHIAAPPHQTLFTLADLQSASPTGEVFVNGQYDVTGSPPQTTYYDSPLIPLPTPNASPVPLARSFVQVEPHPHSASDWDWYQGFNVGSSDPAPTVTPWDNCKSNDSTCGRWTTPVFDITAFSVDNPNGVSLFAYGSFLGQLWDAFDDWEQDVTGRIRFTAQQQASIDADATKFLHVTWSVDTVSTGRRYPQLIVSDQGIPIEDGFKNPNGNFLLVQTIQGPSMRLEVEAFHGLINGNPWAVNNQAPDHALIDYDNWNNGAAAGATLPPYESPFEHAGVDRMTTYDAFVSSGRLYVFMDGKPAGCMLYPANGFALGGPVTVTFGDVLYHEGAETEVATCRSGPTALPFLYNHQCTETKRHWDDLAFKSGVATPQWDEATFACAAY
jgi:hypothetical protein